VVVALLRECLLLGILLIHLLLIEMGKRHLHTERTQIKRTNKIINKSSQ
jgi:ABC-type cobalamin transport system permease subunit